MRRHLTRRWSVRLAAAIALAVLGLGGFVVGAGPAAAAPTGFAQILTLSSTDGSPSACQLARVDAGAGTVSPIGPVFDVATAGCPSDMALRGGLLYGVLNFGDESTPSQLVTIDSTTGVRTSVGSLGFATTLLAGLAVDGDGTMWLYAQNADPACSGGTGQSCLYRLDPTTATPTLVAAAATDVHVLGATTTCTSVLANEFGVSEDGSPSGQLVTVDTQTAALTPRPDSYGAGTLMTSIEHDPNGPLRGLGFTLTETGPQDPAAYTIDADTGVPTKITDFTVAPGQVLTALALAELQCSTPAPPGNATAPAGLPAVPVRAAPSFTG